MKYFFLFSILTLINTNVWLQPELKFEVFTKQNGLVNNDILSICQDAYGFMWFGTKDGCSRFDGVEFKNYQFEKNISGTIAYGWVNDIICDSKNRLWFAIAGTQNTLMRYDYESDKFIDISTSIKNQLSIDDIFSLRRIFIDSDGDIWLSSNDFGSMFYNPESEKVKKIDFQNIIKKGEVNTNDFFEDTDKDIWFATNQGLFIYNKTTEQYSHYKNDTSTSPNIISEVFSCIFQDSDKQIWVGTHETVNKVILKKSRNQGTDKVVDFVHFSVAVKNSLDISNKQVTDITEGNNQNLFIATTNGLYLFDKKKKQIYAYYKDEIDPESFRSNLIRSVYRDKHDNIWIGTDVGIGKLQTKNFSSYSQSSYKNSLSHSKVQSICEVSDSKIWIANPKGVDVFDREKNRFHFIAGITKNESGFYGFPVSLCLGNNGVWVGTWIGGYSFFDTNSGKTKSYITDTKYLQGVFSIIIDKNNNLWAGLSKGGIHIQDLNTGEQRTIIHERGNKHTLNSNNVRMIFESSTSDIWVGTLEGLNLMRNFEHGTFRHYLPGVEIIHITEDGNKRLWFGTAKGLFRYNKNTQDFLKYDASDGLPGNSVLGILEDQSKNLWVSTNMGLARLSFKDDSITKITTYRPEEGVNAGDFIPRSCTKLSDGTMMFGGSNGFTVFHPAAVKEDTLVPSVFITNLKVGQKIVKTGENINGQIILQKSITKTEHLVLNYKNNEFAIEFVGIQYNMPKHNTYAYKLDGYDAPESNWHYVTATEREAKYMNLPGGDYVFKVKAANSYGAWNNKPVSLKITVLPPWWRTFWFRALSTILLLLFIVVFIKLRIRSFKRQKQKLEKLVNDRTIELQDMNLVLKERQEELEQQAQELENKNINLEQKSSEIELMAKQLHDADQSKLRFFANISHEFRTPLTLLIGPLEKYAEINEIADVSKWKDVNNHIKLMLRNARRLLRLVNQIIDFRKLDQGAKKLKVSNNNIAEFIGEIVKAFSVQAEAKNIHLSLNIDHTTFSKEHGEMINDFWFDPDIMEKILYNLISNAIKYTPEGGEIYIQLKVKSEELRVVKRQNQNANSPLITHHSSLIIKITDTGIGIKPENLNKIFDRYYMEKVDDTNSKEGIGIGLSYTKELVELHQGDVSVESEVGKGTTFTLSFPVEAENTKPKEQPAARQQTVKLNYVHSMIDGISNTNEKDDPLETNEDSDMQKSATILIVEDNVDLRKFIKSELNEDYIVIEAENGEEGAETAVRINPDLIISDIMMPVMDGIALCRMMKTDENTSHIPIILLTAKSGEESVIEGLEIGADDYITKPFNISILKIKVQNIIKLRKKMQEKFSQSVDIVPSEFTYKSAEEEFMKKAIEIIHVNIEDVNFDNDSFIEKMNCGRSIVYKKIKHLTDMPVGKFIRSVRLKAAAKLFLEGKTSVSEVSYMTGFKYPNHFSTYFTEMFGKPPVEFIKDATNK